MKATEAKILARKCKKMSEVFYRKWRPKRLDQVVGQEPVIQTLRQAVALGRLAHAYLFCGPRGTGKTSTARILAKAVNCLSPQDGEPDNQCDIRRSINEGRALDLIEIDAASNRGIDDIRNLSDKVNFSPNEARTKVYIIDEVHMLTEPAFNALLKTLEEPPPHAIFILATTEVHKVPLTIISRCQRFDFRRIPLERIVDKLAQLCRHEEIEVDPQALRLIARTASGSLRDAENLLEQVVVSYGSPVSEEHVRDLLELGGDEMALELVSHIVNRAVRDGLMAINRVAGEGSDLRQLHRGVMEHLRATLLLKTNVGTSLGYPEDTMAQLKSLADASSMEHLVLALKTFARADLRRDSSSPLPLELALVESSTEPSPQAVAERQPDRPAGGERRSYAGPTVRSVTARAPPPVEDSPPARPSSAPPNTRPEAEPESTILLPSEPAARLESQWREITRALRHVGKKFKLGALLNVSREREVSEGVISIKFAHRSHVERMAQELDDPETRLAVTEVFARVMDGTYEIQSSLAATGANGPQQGAAQRSHLVRTAQAMGARVVDEKEEEP